MTKNYTLQVLEKVNESEWDNPRTGWIKLNKLLPTQNIADYYWIENKSYEPQVWNLKTGKLLPWRENTASRKNITVSQKTGKNTNIAYDTVSSARDIYR